MSEQLALVVFGAFGGVLTIVVVLVKLVSKRGASIPPPAPKALPEPTAHALPPASTRGGDGDHTRQIRSLMAFKRETEGKLAEMQRALDHANHVNGDLARRLDAQTKSMEQLTDRFHAYQHSTERELGSISALLEKDD